MQVYFGPNSAGISVELWFRMSCPAAAPSSFQLYYQMAATISGQERILEFEEGRDDMILNPVVVFEVLSYTTMDYDRGTKFVAYRQIPSLREYVLVDQYSHRVEHCKKEDGGQWRLEDLTDIGKVLHLSSIDVKLPLERIYRRLDLEKNSESLHGRRP